MSAGNPAQKVYVYVVFSSLMKSAGEISHVKGVENRSSVLISVPLALEETLLSISRWSLFLETIMVPISAYYCLLGTACALLESLFFAIKLLQTVIN